jgi:hypothetical protein
MTECLAWAYGDNSYSLGYDHLVRNILHISALCECSGAGKSNAVKTHFWRGFRSLVGSVAAAPDNRQHLQGRRGQTRGRLFRGHSCHHPVHLTKETNRRI